MTTDRNAESELVCDPTEPTEGNLFVSAYPPFSCWTSSGVPDVDAVLQTEPADRAGVPLGLYVHIPFCLKRCEFCYYRSVANPASGTIDSYLDSVLNEIRMYSGQPRLAGRRPEFVYFGGGTPALLAPKQMQRLFEGIQSVFPWDDVKEVTFECSPQAVTRERLEVLRQAGVTRISMGVQQMNDSVLQQSGRIHLIDDIRRAYAEIRQHDFNVVNVDLMVGLVGETEQTFQNSLHDVISMAPDSITFYQLEIPANTPLYRAVQDGQVETLASWDEKRARLADAFALLEGEGYTQRSAYAAVRDPIQHTFHYQDMQYHGADLLGTGLASFSLVGGVHYQNLASLSEYQASLSSDQLPYVRGYALSPDEQMVREFILQLKLGSVETKYFEDKFNVNVADRFSHGLQQFSDQGWLLVERDSITLTRQGLLRVDRLLPEFYLPEHRDRAYW